MSRCHCWIEVGDTEKEVIVHYDFQPAEPDVNVGASITLTGVYDLNGSRVVTNVYQEEQIEECIIHKITEEGK